MQHQKTAVYTSDRSTLNLLRYFCGIVSKLEVTSLHCTVMLLFTVLSYFVCLLLPGLASAHFTIPKDPANLAAHNVKRLSTPLKNLLHKRNLTSFAGVSNASNALALNSTDGEIEETITFEEQINIPEIGSLIYFFVC